MVKIINIIPITKGNFKEEFSYFGAGNYRPGEFVKVNLRGREVKGLVSSIKPIKEVKSDLRRADFALKKIEKQESFFLCQPDLLKAADLASDYFCTSLGQVLKSLIPTNILNNLEQLPKNNLHYYESDESELKNEPLIIQESDEDRLGIYKGLIRECFAKRQSVFLMVPTTIDILLYKDYLEKGIDKYTYTFNSKMKNKEMLEQWKKALLSKHPILIIATPSFLSIPRSDIKTIIVERENSDFYKEISRPLIDYRKMAEFISKEGKKRLILGDFAMRTETIYRLAKKEYYPLFPLKYRLPSSAKQILIDLTKEKDNILTKEITDVIKEVKKEKKKKLFILNNLRGAISAIYCRDCGQVKKCSECSAPLVIHQDKETRKLICHKCGKLYKLEDNCPNCQGWRLELLGEGIDRIASLVEEVSSDLNIHKLSSDYAKTSLQAEKIVDSFLTKENSILIGTEMALHYLRKKINYVAITSIDNILAIPDFRSNERVLNILLRARNLAEERFIIQTRNKDNKIFESVIKGNILDFYREETAFRKMFNYPPFKILIKITLIGNEKTETEAEILAEKFKKWKPFIYPAFNYIIKGKRRWNILIKLSPEEWPDEYLLDILKNNTPYCIVDVEPQNIL